VKSHSQFKRRVLLLFIIVSILPAITVSALWYTLTRQLASTSFITVGNFVAPIAFLGLLPALVVGIIFAEMLAIPIRRLHQGIAELTKNNFGYRVPSTRITEFHEMAQLLNAISTNLQGVLSQKDSENTLLAAERNKLQSVLNNMGDGVVAIDRANRIIMVNKAALALTEQKFENVAGQPLGDSLPIYSRGKSAILDWLGNQPIASTEAKDWKDLELTTKSGQTLRIDAKTILLHSDPNGIRMLMTFHDLTHPRQLAEMEVNFVALAAHELRTPIATTKGYLDILESDLGKINKDAKEALQRSQLGINQLSMLVNNLLNVSRIEQGELVYHMEPTDWEDFMKEATKELQQRISAWDRKLVVKSAKNLPRVAIDRMAITEILYNLVDNAVKHTTSGSTITIDTNRSHDGIQLTVTDTGIGIPKEAQSQLFQKFYRVEGLKSHSGTGLGLYICRQIAEAHYGHMWLESAEGKGATFGLNLPEMAKIATKLKKSDNKTKIIRGVHGWIKTHSDR
jgi:signal transduction histidine kinase